MPEATTDRRPLASRNRRIWIHVAHSLALRRVSPNAISVMGMIAGVAAGAMFAMTAQAARGFLLAEVNILERAFWIVGAAMVQVRLLCNLLDGMVAIERKVASRVGELYNEVPDRVSDVAVFVGLGCATGSNVMLGLIAALGAVLTAYVRAAIKVAGAPNDYRGPMAKPHRMFVCTICAVLMAMLPGAWRPGFVIPDLEIRWTIPCVALALVSVGCVLTCVRRLWRASAILRSKPNT